MITDLFYIGTTIMCILHIHLEMTDNKNFKYEIWVKLAFGGMAIASLLLMFYPVDAVRTLLIGTVFISLVFRYIRRINFDSKSFILKLKELTKNLL